MRVIAAFVGEDSAASRMYDAFADFYERLAADYQGSKAEIELIERFVADRNDGADPPKWSRFREPSVNSRNRRS